MKKSNKIPGFSLLLTHEYSLFQVMVPGLDLGWWFPKCGIGDDFTRYINLSSPLSSSSFFYSSSIIPCCSSLQLHFSHLSLQFFSIWNHKLPPPIVQIYTMILVLNRPWFLIWTTSVPYRIRLHELALAGLFYKLHSLPVWLISWQNLFSLILHIWITCVLDSSDFMKSCILHCCLPYIILL